MAGLLRPADSSTFERIADDANFIDTRGVASHPLPVDIIPTLVSVDSSVVLTVVSLAIATTVAVIVPWVTFRLAIRQDHTRWLREQRAQVYVDLLTETYAEQQWIEFDMADDETREQIRPHFHDLRLPPLERARLGVRATMYSSRTVNALSNRLPAEAFWALLNPRADEGNRLATRMRIGRIHDELQAVIRAEMGTDKWLKQGQSSLLQEPHPAQRNSTVAGNSAPTAP